MSTLTAVLPARRVLTGAAALGVAAGLVALGAPHADAAPRAVASQAAAGSVSSRVVADYDGIAIRSTVGAAAGNTTVSTAVRGKVTIACFDSSGVVESTRRSVGWVTTDGISAFAEAGAGTSTVLAPVSLRGIQRDMYGELDALDCAAGTTAGFRSYWITSVESTRTTYAGVQTGVSSSTQHYTYRFPAPLV